VVRLHERSTASRRDVLDVAEAITEQSKRPPAAFAGQLPLNALDQEDATRAESFVPLVAAQGVELRQERLTVPGPIGRYGAV
jgi:hypothetical protein